MPKMKTKKTLLKRIKITKGGKIMKKNSQTGHLKIKSDASTKSRKKGLKVQLGFGQIKRLRTLLARFGKGIGKK